MTDNVCIMVTISELQSCNTNNSQFKLHNNNINNIQNNSQQYTLSEVKK